MLSILLTGCIEEFAPAATDADASKFIGRCQEGTSNDVGEYHADGTYAYTYASCDCEYTGTWKLVNGRLVITYPDDGLSYTFDYYFDGNNVLYKQLLSEDHYDVWNRVV